MANENVGCEFINEKELAKLLGVSQKLIQHWRYHDIGPTWYRLSRSIRYRRSEVEAWIAAQTKGGAS